MAILNLLDWRTDSFFENQRYYGRDNPCVICGCYAKRPFNSIRIIQRELPCTVGLFDIGLGDAFQYLIIAPNAPILPTDEDLHLFPLCQYCERKIPNELKNDG